MKDRQLFSSTDRALPEKLLSIAEEFRAGFAAVEQIDRPAVSIFGSARLGEDTPGYQAARAVGRHFAERGWAVITGGGPGIMEAANRGAKGRRALDRVRHRAAARAGTEPLPRHLVHLHALLRAQGLLREARGGFVIFPGGFGTLDELFEALTLIQTGKAENFPVVLYDTDYWGELLAWIRSEMLADGMISPEDLDLLHATDDPIEAAEDVIEYYETRSAEVPAAAEKADAQ